MISAAMFVRNEAPYIEDALRSLVGVADEAVVVDTGSDDGTPDLVRALDLPIPVSLFFEPWREDFAWHRNHVQGLCPGDWILVLDGDERIQEPGNLREAIESTPKDGVAVTLRCHISESRYEEHWAVRAYRAAKGYWTYPIHNQLDGVSSVDPSTSIFWSNYSGTLKAKCARSIPMLEKFHREHPFDPHPPFFLSKTYRSLADWARCRHWGEICRDLAGDDPRYAVNYVWLFHCSLMLDGGDLTKASRIAAEALHRHPRFSEAYHCRMSLDAIKWADALQAPGEYVFQSQTSKQFLENLPEAARLLGLQLQVKIDDRKEQGE